jgi:putative PIG3 family NAD(P)H quinone oxidoreductase
MKAIRNTAAGGPDVLHLVDVPTPSYGAGQLLVRVAAAGLNRADILQRRGHYPAPPGWPADIPGLEYAGTVEAVGEGVTRWTAGDRVMGLVGGGAQAEYVVVDQGEALAVPAGIELADAAAIPEAFLTAWDALTIRGRMRPGERVLLHAVGSGVGTAAIQLVRRMGGISVGTSRTAAKLEQVMRLGLDEAIDSSGGRSFRDALLAPVHLILDVLGGPALADNLAVLAPRGRLVLLGNLQGPKAEVSLEPVLRKRLEIIGSVMRTRQLEERLPLVAAFAAEVLPWFTGGEDRLRPVIAARVPMAEIARAHAIMEQDANVGKIVLVW